jgi:hypothetical protein
LFLDPAFTQGASWFEYVPFLIRAWMFPEC